MIPRLKHVYSGITLTSADLAGIVHHWRRLAAPAISANRCRLDDIGQLATLVRDEPVIEELAIHAVHGERWLAFTWVPAYVLIQGSDPDRSLVPPFTAVAELLAAKAKNGCGSCLIEVVPLVDWRPPAAAESTWARLAQWIAQLVRRPRTA